VQDGFATVDLRHAPLDLRFPGGVDLRLMIPKREMHALDQLHALLRRELGGLLGQMFDTRIHGLKYGRMRRATQPPLIESAARPKNVAAMTVRKNTHDDLAASHAINQIILFERV